MVFLDLAGLQLSAGSGKEAGKKLQKMYSRLSERPTLNTLFRTVTVVPMRTSVHSDVDLRNKSEVNQGTLLF